MCHVETVFQRRDFCNDAQKLTLPDRYKRYLRPGAFGGDIRAFATAVVEAQEKRHTADYDPMVQMKQTDAILLNGIARAPLQQFQNANPDEKNIFLMLLLFDPRR